MTMHPRTVLMAVLAAVCLAMAAPAQADDPRAPVVRTWNALQDLRQVARRAATCDELRPELEAYAASAGEFMAARKTLVDGCSTRNGGVLVEQRYDAAEPSVGTLLILAEEAERTCPGDTRIPAWLLKDVRDTLTRAERSLLVLCRILAFPSAYGSCDCP